MSNPAWEGTQRPRAIYTRAHSGDGAAKLRKEPSERTGKDSVSSPASPAARPGPEN
ncbi:hypothetical protein GCM10020221_07800 [Streptomyces thioluteus]|uniref:Uncharacterized protein n=1 Tax=Streptomyces thioluteus TaxID=66431 RepID=A0ABN3WGK7_STRTU